MMQNGDYERAHLITGKLRNASSRTVEYGIIPVSARVRPCHLVMNADDRNQ